MPYPLKVVFMGTPEFAVPSLQSLIESDHEIVAVYCQPPRPANRGKKETKSPVQELAEANGLPVFHPSSLKGEAEQKQFAEHKADIALVAAYGLILPKAVLEAYPMGCINIHPSDLPRWRGAAPIQRTILAGDTQSACCIMQMDEGLDTGAVLRKETIPIPDAMTAGQLHDRMAALGAALALRTMARMAKEGLEAQPQETEGVTYAEKISKEEAKIDWSKPAVEILRHIRGMNPAPGAFTYAGEERIKVLDAVVVDATSTAGSVLDAKLLVACGEQALRITRLQRAGKQAQDAEEFLRGFPIDQGTQLG